MMTTVTKIEMQFIRNVKSRYLAMSGRTSEVGGRIFETRSRKTTSDSRIDMPSVTFSPARHTERQGLLEHYTEWSTYFAI